MTNKVLKRVRVLELVQTEHMTVAQAAGAGAVAGLSAAARAGRAADDRRGQAIAGEAAAPTGRLTAETRDCVRLLLDHVGIDPALVRT